MKLSTISLSAFVFCGMGSAQVYGACDVQQFIFDDKIIYTADDLVRLSVLNEIEGYKDENSINKVDASLLIPGYFDGKYDQDKRRSLIQRQYRMLNLDLSQESRRTIIASHLSDNSVKMYEACLNQYGLTIKAPPHALYSDEFSVEVHYRPGAGAAAADLFVNGKPKIVVTHGNIKDDFIPLLPEKILPDEELGVLITRDLNQTTEIFANIGGKRASIALPPISRSKIAFQLRTRTETVDAFKGKPHDNKEFCYEAKAGEVIFPETATLTLDSRLPPNDLNKGELLKDKSNELQACPMTISELQALTPGFDWKPYLEAANLPKISRVVVGELSAFPKIADVFARGETLTVEHRGMSSYTIWFTSTPGTSPPFEIHPQVQKEQSLNWKPTSLNAVAQQIAAVRIFGNRVDFNLVLEPADPNRDSTLVIQVGTVQRSVTVPPLNQPGLLIETVSLGQKQISTGSAQPTVDGGDCISSSQNERGKQHDLSKARFIPSTAKLVTQNSNDPRGTGVSIISQDARQICFKWHLNNTSGTWNSIWAGFISVERVREDTRAGKLFVALPSTTDPDVNDSYLNELLIGLH
jgi:hypothetical protein